MSDQRADSADQIHARGLILIGVILQDQVYGLGKLWARKIWHKDPSEMESWLRNPSWWGGRYRGPQLQQLARDEYELWRGAGTDAAIRLVNECGISIDRQRIIELAKKNGRLLLSKKRGDTRGRIGVVRATEWR